MGPINENLGKFPKMRSYKRICTNYRLIGPIGPIQQNAGLPRLANLENSESAAPWRGLSQPEAIPLPRTRENVANGLLARFRRPSKEARLSSTQGCDPQSEVFSLIFLQSTRAK
jgi:hypothetical protein